jgi:hypothetical protein
MLPSGTSRIATQSNFIQLGEPPACPQSLP